MRVELAPEIAPRLRKALQTAGQRETGGILFAEQLQPGHFRVIEFSLDLHGGSHSDFQRDPSAHKKTMEEFFDKTGHDYRRFNYLGEWHSHPSIPVHPSPKDINSMIDLVESDQSGITFAVLLIVRLRFRMWLDYSITAFVQGYRHVEAVYGRGRNPILLVPE